MPTLLMKENDIIDCSDWIAEIDTTLKNYQSNIFKDERLFADNNLLLKSIQFSLQNLQNTKTNDFDNINLHINNIKDYISKLDSILSLKLKDLDSQLSQLQAQLSQSVKNKKEQDKNSRWADKYLKKIPESEDEDISTLRNLLLWVKDENLIQSGIAINDRLLELHYFCESIEKKETFSDKQKQIAKDIVTDLEDKIPNEIIKAAVQKLPKTSSMGMFASTRQQPEPPAFNFIPGSAANLGGLISCLVYIINYIKYQLDLSKWNKQNKQQPSQKISSRI